MNLSSPESKFHFENFDELSNREWEERWGHQNLYCYSKMAKDLRCYFKSHETLSSPCKELPLHIMWFVYSALQTAAKRTEFLHQKVLNYRSVALGLCNLMVNTPIETS